MVNSATGKVMLLRLEQRGMKTLIDAIKNPSAPLNTSVLTTASVHSQSVTAINRMIYIDNTSDRAIVQTSSKWKDKQFDVNVEEKEMEWKRWAQKSKAQVRSKSYSNFRYVKCCVINYCTANTMRGSAKASGIASASDAAI